MSDKLAQGVAIIPTFSAGESPSPEKLNALSIQVKKSLTGMEKAIGDIHSQSWPYSPNSTTKLSGEYGRSIASENALSGTTERSLDIANIARLIGPASNLNPRTLTEEATIVENVPRDVFQFSLKYIPKGPISSTNPVFSDTATHITFKSSPQGLVDYGDYHVTSQGVVYRMNAPAGHVDAGTVSYTYDVAANNGGNNYQGARFNTIPDPNQADAGTGLTVNAIGGDDKHLIELPTITHQQSNLLGTGTTLTDLDANFGQQLKLPKVLTDNFFTGEQIPPGFLYLRNHTTNKVYENATYWYESETEFKIGNVDLTTEIAAGDVFVAFTVGTDITTSIDDLRKKAFHNHDRTNGEPFVDIDSIVGFTREVAMGNSLVAGNFAPQYLHRYGFQDSPVDDNWNRQNAMLGDIYFAGLADTKYTGITGAGETYGLKFGSGKRIYVDADEDLIIGGAFTTTDTYLLDVTKLVSGIDGDHEEAASQPIKFYSINTTISPVTLPSPAPYTITLPAAFSGKHIYSVTGFASGSASSAWYPINGEATAATRTITCTIDTSGLIPEILLVFTGADWSGDTNIKLRYTVMYTDG